MPFGIQDKLQVLDVLLAIQSIQKSINSQEL